MPMRRGPRLAAAVLVMAALGCAQCQAGQPEEQEGKAMAGKGPVRASILAGSWYPANPVELRQMVQGFLAQAEALKGPGRPVALVAPHAGLIYSGQVAAHAYKQLVGQRIDLIVLVGPSHRAYLSGCAVYPAGAWRTPLGEVEIDEEVARALTSQSPLIKPDAQTHAVEHSLEIQLPFIQEVAPQARIVPVMMGEQDIETARGLAQALVAALKGYRGRFVLVASTDLSHFHGYEAAQKLDRLVCERLQRFDAEGLGKDLAAGKSEACGGGPTLAVMLAAKELGASGAKLLKYANSGDVTGERSKVVGYAAAVFYGQGGNPGHAQAPEPKAAPGGRLSAAERELLRRIALRSVECAARGESPPPELLKEAALKAALAEHCGAFVTLKRGGELRGCIGDIIGSGPLGETVAQMARAAATQDPRFPPLRPEDLKDLDLEISVLTPLEPVRDVNDIVVGKHGLFIVYGNNRGLLLPQVATEQGWDRETFLEQTCWKAGLPPGAWRHPEAQIYRFGAEIF